MGAEPHNINRYLCGDAAGRNADVMRQDLRREQDISVSAPWSELLDEAARGEPTLPDTTKFLCEADIARKSDQRIGSIPPQIQPNREDSLQCRVQFRMSRDTSLSKPLALARRNSAFVRRRHQ